MLIDTVLRCMVSCKLQEKTRPLIQRYHGREALFDWMIQQISEAVYQNKEVTPYPDFLQQRIAEGKVLAFSFISNFVV